MSSDTRLVTDATDEAQSRASSAREVCPLRMMLRNACDRLRWRTSPTVAGPPPGGPLRCVAS